MNCFTKYPQCIMGSNAIWRHRSGLALARAMPNGTKLFHEPMLTDHLWCSVAFTWKWFQWNCNMCHESVITILKLFIRANYSNFMPLYLEKLLRHFLVPVTTNYFNPIDNHYFIWIHNYSFLIINLNISTRKTRLARKFTRSWCA